MNPENPYPFRGELESLKEGVGFDIQKLKIPEKAVELPGGREREFSTPEYAITEYFDEGGKNHEKFAKLKQFYESAQKDLGDFLPKAFFVGGEPSNPDRQGKSFYVVQKFDDTEFNKTAKKLDELNAREFSVDFLNELLLIQERINPIQIGLNS